MSFNLRGQCGRPKARCWEHGGSALCRQPCVRAGTDKVRCLLCGGSQKCPMTCATNPGKNKAHCLEHGETQLCPATCATNAGKKKRYCQEHGGSRSGPPGDTKQTTPPKQPQRRFHRLPARLCPPTCKRAGKPVADCVEHGGRHGKLMVLQDGDSVGARHRALASEVILRDYGFSPAFKYEYPTRSVPLRPILQEPPQPLPQPLPQLRYEKPLVLVLGPVPLARIRK